MAAADPSLAPGTVVGGYRIEYRLGAGGVGTVYAAEEPTIKKRVAIKVLRRAFADDEAAIARFEREARAANDVRHPAIVDVFGFGKLPDGRPYLVMNLLEGRSLREEIAARGKLPGAEAWALARAIAEALSAAHEAGIVHRDLKPDNVFLERHRARSGATSTPPRPRILDFGLAKLQPTADSDDEPEPMKLTQTGAPVGTPVYMAPEQWWASGIGPHTDQYAFGVLLFEMLAGEPPFRSQQYVELVQQHMNERPPSLADVGVAVPAAVETLVARMLAKKPEARLSSMAAVIEEGDRAFAASPPSTFEGGIPGGLDGRLDGGARGDGAFAEPAEAATEIASEPLSAAVSRAAGSTASAASEPKRVLAQAGRLRRCLAVQVSVLFAGLAAILAVGYAGPDRHHPLEWMKIAGWGSFLTIFWSVVGVAMMFRGAFKRAQGGVPSHAAWWFALMPGFAGAIGTYTGWMAITERYPTWAPAVRFTTFSSGMYEANACRFMGFWVASLLFIGLAALPGISGVRTTTVSLVDSRGASRRLVGATALGLVALAAAALAAGAPSGALVAGAAAAALAVGVVLPTVHPDTAARDEIERAVAELLAVGLAAAVGFARIEAREAVLWDSETTRAARAAEIVAASGERTATLVLAVASIAVVIVVEGLRIRRLLPLAALRRPRPRTIVLAAVVVLAVIADQSVHAWTRGTREALREALAPQFSLFARLDPPSGEGLDATRFAPHEASALQIARDAVALNGTGVAKLAALESPDGAMNVGRDLSHALGARAVDASPDAPDLAVMIDREVRWESVLSVLRVARGAGARRLEILLTRGPAPVLAARGPAEAGYVLASDFVAIAAELPKAGDEREGDLTAPLDQTFGTIAPELVRRVLEAKGPTRIAVPR